MKVLVVDDQHSILEFLKDVLEGERYEVITADNGVSALELFQEHRPFFTLTDITMPGMTGLELLSQIKELDEGAVVMLMTGAGSETFAVEALRRGAANYFQKPIDINELINTFARYATLATDYDAEYIALEFLKFEKLELTIANNLEHVNRAIQMLTDHAAAVFPLSEIYTLRFGLYEMLINAVEHGNLGITYDEKSRALEENRLNELIKERSSDPERAQKRVWVTCEISPDGFGCSIKDEGKGFDHSKYSAVQDPAALFEQVGTSLHGRGLVLTRLQFDEVSYNDQGNEVHIYKRNPMQRR